MSLGVFLCGEGKTELGSRIGPTSFQSDAQRGVIEALLRRVREDGFHVVGALEWRRIKKLRASGPTPKLGPNEARNVERLVLHAAEAKADVLAFTRDGDNQAEERRAALREGLELAATERPDLAIAGAIAAPCIEGWMLALTGVRGTEAMSGKRATDELAARSIEASTAALVALVEAAELAHAADDALGLLAWLGDARRALQEGEGALPV